MQIPLIIVVIPILILCVVAHYKAVEVATDEVSCDDRAVENQDVNPILGPKLPRGSQVVECVCHTVRESASDEQRYSEQHRQTLALTSEGYYRCHDESTTDCQQASAQWT